MTKEEHRRYDHLRYLANKKEFLRYAANWRKRNPEKRKEIQKKYRNAHPKSEKDLQATRDWRTKNKQRIKKYNTYWSKKNRDYRRFLNSRLRIKKMGIKPTLSFEEWLQLKIIFNYTCPACYRKEPEILLSEDHIIPLSKGGSDHVSNIQPLCRGCNSHKRARIIVYAPRKRFPKRIQ